MGKNEKFKGQRNRAGEKGLSEWPTDPGGESHRAPSENSNEKQGKSIINYSQSSNGSLVLIKKSKKLFQSHLKLWPNSPFPHFLNVPCDQSINIYFTPTV